MRRSVPLLALASCAACQSKPAASVEPDSKTAFVDKVADTCGLPRDAIRLIGGDKVTLRPAPDADYQSVDCAIEKLGQSKVLKLGFVGNEHFNLGQPHAR